MPALQMSAQAQSAITALVPYYPLSRRRDTNDTARREIDVIRLIIRRQNEGVRSNNRRAIAEWKWQKSSFSWEMTAWGTSGSLTVELNVADKTEPLGSGHPIIDVGREENKRFSRWFSPLNIKGNKRKNWNDTTQTAQRNELPKSARLVLASFLLHSN